MLGSGLVRRYAFVPLSCDLMVLVVTFGCDLMCRYAFVALGCDLVCLNTFVTLENGLVCLNATYFSRSKVAWCVFTHLLRSKTARSHGYMKRTLCDCDVCPWSY